MFWRLIKLRTEAVARIAQAEREKKYQEELENKRKYEEARKKRQEKQKKRSPEIITEIKQDNRESRADRARRRLVLCNWAIQLLHEAAFWISLIWFSSYALNFFINTYVFCMVCMAYFISQIVLKCSVFYIKSLIVEAYFLQYRIWKLFSLSLQCHRKEYSSRAGVLFSIFRKTLSRRNLIFTKKRSSWYTMVFRYGLNDFLG